MSYVYQTLKPEHPRVDEANPGVLSADCRLRTADSKMQPFWSSTAQDRHPPERFRP